MGGKGGEGGVKPFSLGKKAYQIHFNLERKSQKENKRERMRSFIYT